MTTCSVFIATSVDGFIARTDGAIDWLQSANAPVPPGEDCGYAEFMSVVDGLVMGRKTFEHVLTFKEWPYGVKPVFVLSRSLSELPSDTPTTVRLSSEEPPDLVRRLGAQGFRHLYVDGELTIQSFLAAGLIEQITITTVPILLGSGKGLFGSLPSDVLLEHLSTRAFPFGFVQSKYRIAKSAPNNAGQAVLGHEQQE